MKRPHPYFDDRETFDWETELDPALARARSEGKRVLIEYGREKCAQCRALVQSVLPRPEIAELIQRGFVLVASDCDESEEAVEELAVQLEDAMMLPFVLIADAHGQFLEGFSGTVEPERLRRTLERLTPTPEGEASPSESDEATA